MELLLDENASVDIANILSSGQGHRHVQLIADDFNRLGDTGLPASAVSVGLFSLEMKKLVRQLPGKMFLRSGARE